MALAGAGAQEIPKLVDLSADELRNRQGGVVDLEGDAYLYRLLSLQKAIADGGSLGNEFKDLVQDQLKYLRLAMKAIKEDEEYKRKYGKDMTGVKALADKFRDAAEGLEAESKLRTYVKKTTRKSPFA